MKKVHVTDDPEEIRAILRADGVELMPPFETVEKLDEWIDKVRPDLRPGQITVLEMYWDHKGVHKSNREVVTNLYHVLQGERIAQPDFPTEGGPDLVAHLMHWAGNWGPLS